MAKPSDDLGRQTGRVLAAAEVRLGTAITPVSALHTEGVLSTDPAYRLSAAATAQVEFVYGWAMCARLAEGDLATDCRTAATNAVLSWVTTYQPSGNPIDENRLIPLLQSIDLMLPLLSADQQETVLAWTARLAERGEQLFATLPPTSGRLRNNWFSWHLAITGMAARLTRDGALQERVRIAAHRHIAQNIAADGSSLDFAERDALHYHVYNLQALVALDLYSDLLGADDRESIVRALEFLRPYFVGEQVHLEFAGSPNAFDRQRREDGDPTFAIAPWDPARARPLLRLARGRYPDIRRWTESVADENYAPRLKQLAELHARP